MPGLSQQRCFQHSLREAVARCPECRRYFCRECVTEHDDRLLCASCIRSLARVPLSRSNPFVQGFRVAQVLLGVTIALIFFYVLGRQLLAIPSTFHDGSVWRIDASESR